MSLHLVSVTILVFKRLNEICPEFFEKLQLSKRQIESRKKKIQIASKKMFRESLRNIYAIF